MYINIFKTEKKIKCIILFASGVKKYRDLQRFLKPLIIKSFSK